MSSNSIQRIIGPAISSVAEANFALNHMNLDFSLVKIGAPAELQPLGNLLSTNRRESAETGPFHILARRLGTLFDDILPGVPSLLKAYGSRASEIAQAATNASNQSTMVTEGIFADHVGIDSTTIWATATSGKAVLRMHLLACMLARLWSSQEATAIWSELVTYRQMQIRRAAEEEGMMTNAMAYAAAAHKLDYSSFEEWDASARSWLEVADKAKRKQQLQIKLIVDNLSVAVKESTGDYFGLAASEAKGTLYKNVISNFIQALSALDRLVAGVPQRVHAGDVLLGLTSWHLYPDLVVLGPKTIEVHQEDALVGTGGVVTVAMSPKDDCDPCAAKQGVYWSLALSSLRYYGTVHARRSTLHDSTRLSISQLQLLALGATLDQDVLVLIELSAQIIEYVRAAVHDHLRQYLDQSHDEFIAEFRGLQFLSCFADGCQLLLHGEKVEQKEAKKLVNYGSRHGREWIGNPRSSTPLKMFGLTDLRHLLPCLLGVNARISTLRSLCEGNEVDPISSIIRYRTDAGAWACVSILQAPDSLSGSKAGTRGTKRKRDQETPTRSAVIAEMNIEASHDEEWVFLHESRNHHSNEYYSGSSPSTKMSRIFDDWLRDSPTGGKLVVIYDLVCGDPECAAVYVRREGTDREPKIAADLNYVPLEMVINLLKTNTIDIGLAARLIQRTFAEDRRDHGTALLTLGRITEYYKSNLSDATVSIRVITKPIHSWTWSRTLAHDIEAYTNKDNVRKYYNGSIVSFGVYCSPVCRTQAFACILQLESGTITVDPGLLQDVMAVSSGNSLFIANILLCDPDIRKEGDRSTVKHVVGNVGKPGIALLVATAMPEIRKHKIEEWHLSTHVKYDGERPAGIFDGTSLHLSFTGYEAPLILEPSGVRGHEAYFLETRVSLNDRGNWVADLNVLKAFKGDNIRGLDFDGSCNHNPSFANIKHEMKSIDCWEEFLDPPGTIMVVRATTSWMARLAAVSVASLRGYICRYLTPDGEICWECVMRSLSLHRSLGLHREQNTVIVL